MATKSRPGAANLQRGRMGRRTGFGVGAGGSPLDTIAPWRVTAKRWRNARWGAADWRENAIDYSQVVDIDLPEGDPPPGGWPCLGRAHAAQGVHTVTDGSSIDTLVRSVALANGIAFITFAGRHPALSATAELMPDDVPVFWAWLTAIAPHLGINPEAISFFTQSRGSMVLEAALRVPAVNPEMLWCINPQSDYRPLSVATRHLATPADIAAALAATPDDPRQNSAWAEVATAQRVPKLVALHEGAYWQRKVSYAEYNVWGNHLPDQGLDFYQAYKDRGLTDSIVVADQVSGNANTMAGIVPTLLLVRQGVPLADAVAIALGNRKGHAVHYIDNPMTGVAKQQDGSGGTPAQGDVIGRIVDARFGPANRTALNPLGNPAGNIGTVRPRLQTLANGNFAARFDADDKLICPMTIPNTASYGFAWWDTSSFNSVPSQISSTQIAWGYPNTDQVLSVVADTPLLPSELRLYSHLASRIAGVDLFGTIDKVTAAGGRYVLDDRTRYVRQGLSFSRAQQVLGPQVDGSLAAYTGSQVPWEAQGVRLDPGWSQYAASPTDVTNATWAKTRCTAEAVTATHPFGGSSMSLIKEDTSNNSHFFQSTVLTSVVGASYTARAIIYPAGRTHAAFVFTGAGGSDRGVFVNLVTGQVTGAFASFPARYGASLRPDGGVEVFIGETVSAAAGYAARVYLGSATNTTIYQGDGTSGIRLAALNHTNTNYEVPYVSSAVTVPSFAFSGLLADMGITLGSEYTLIATYRLANLTTDYQPLVFSLSNGTFNESVYLNAATTIAGRPASMSVVDNGVGQATQAGFGPNAAVGVRRRAAVRVRANDIRPAWDGQLGVADTSATLPTLDRLFIGLNWQGSAGNTFQGWIESLAVVPAIGLTDAQLQDLSAL